MRDLTKVPTHLESARAPDTDWMLVISIVVAVVATALYR